MDIHVKEGPIQTINEYILLLDEVGEWLWNKGVKQWEPGIHRKNYEKIYHLAENGYLILAYHNVDLAGGCILSEIVPEFWPNDPYALSLNGLVVARFAAGYGVGKKIIDHCIKVGVERKKSLLRLDCWDGNDFLKNYYQNAGFEMLESIKEEDYWIRLFEKQIL